MADNPQVTMTTEEFATAQRMLQVVRGQIALLKRKVDRRDANWRLAATDKQTFFYSSDDNGVINFHSDSSFVAEQIFVYGMPGCDRMFLSIEDVSSGRGYTRAQEPNFTDPTDVVTKLDGIWIPPTAWAPTVPYVEVDPVGSFTPAFWNFDHVATLETELAVARGGSLKFRFRHSSDGSFHPNGYSSLPGGNPNLNYVVTLIGYKVY